MLASTTPSSASSSSSSVGTSRLPQANVLLPVSSVRRREFVGAFDLAASDRVQQDHEPQQNQVPSPSHIAMPMPMPTTAMPKTNGTSPHANARVTPAMDHAQRKELERVELVEMLLESIAHVPLAVAQIHTNARLRSALEAEVGARRPRMLARFFEGGGDFDTDTSANSREESDVEAEASAVAIEAASPWPDSTTQSGSGSENDSDSDSDSSRSSRSSSGYGSQYENDLEEAVNQLVMSDHTVSSAFQQQQQRQFASPIDIERADSGDDGVGKMTNGVGSPLSSMLGSSPGLGTQDGEPTAALWPRQPHHFAFTQEDEDEDGDADARERDEVYSEAAAASDDDEEEDKDGSDVASNANEVNDASDDEDDTTIVGRNGVLGRRRQDEDDDLLKQVRRAIGHTASSSLGAEETGVAIDDGDSDSDGCDETPREPEYDVMQLRIIREKGRTGFEPSEDWRPIPGSMIAGRYKVQLEIGEAVFSRTYKCLDSTTHRAVCLKIIKNSKDYFDQGVDEVRILEFIAQRCDVDEKHLVRLLDYFYFREHLILVTELLRDNLYEFSRLLKERGNINYFTLPRVQLVAVQVLEALECLHTMGLVHCDLKPENILFSNFHACRVKVIDFGSACFVSDDLTSYVQSRSYRAPEVILGLTYDHKIDMWSLGCVLAELYTGDVLFKNDSEQSLLERIIGTIGPIPAVLLAESKALLRQFSENPAFKLDVAGNGVLAQPSGIPSLESIVHTTDTGFLDFLRALLQIHPHERLTPSQALKHPWLRNVNVQRGGSDVLALNGVVNGTLVL